ncbi:hypothetical protein [Novosphingobium pokkalii]|uniref:Uncharacterized protein n=1 Tax=Novosphingobium pokkalii TaxID=1770194 RepID=A0ABV7V618_9SPHN|nr:hypothetical protein [Novosphingobium pokkalii]GHD04374.1 hypothetical protein GCM10019060_41100 [Novosphingobium pokkalii]
MAEKGKERNQTSRGPLGDARPDSTDNDTRTGGGRPVQKVEDRPMVGTVKPEDYPFQQ